MPSRESPPPVGTLQASTPTRRAMLVNALVFQGGWFACVLGAAQGWPWAGTGFAIAVLAWHLLGAARPAQEAKLAAAAVAIGLVFDAAMLALGLVDYPNGWFAPGLGPHWMAALWLQFALTLNVSMRWLHGRAGLAALLGAIAGPLSFWGGARLGAATLVEPIAALAFLAVGWGLLMPALMRLAGRFDGIAPRAGVVSEAPRPPRE